MKALITGGAGFYWLPCSRIFYETWHRSTCYWQFKFRFLKNIPFVNNEHIYIKDITDFEFVTQLIQKEQFDFVIHLAAMVSVVETIEKPELSNRINIDATVNILEAIRTYNPNIKKSYLLLLQLFMVIYPIYLNP